MPKVFREIKKIVSWGQWPKVLCKLGQESLRDLSWGSQGWSPKKLLLCASQENLTVLSITINRMDESPLYILESW